MWQVRVLFLNLIMRVCKKIAISLLEANKKLIQFLRDLT